MQELLADLDCVVPQLPVSEAVRGQAVDDAEGIAELVVEAGADDARRAEVYEIIRAGTRDRWLFSGGWSELTVSGNVVSRFATDQTATLVVPLPEARPYKFVLRLDPLGDSATLRQKVRVLINQQTVEVLQLQWDPERVGQYEVSPPAGVLRRGMNEITLQSENMVSIGHTGDAFPEIPRDRDVGVRLWYVLIVPA